MNQNVKSWDQTFMDMAKIISLRSKDPRSQLGSVIIEPFTKRVVSVGYNGFPRNFKDTSERWKRETKSKYVIHAEQNAILNAYEDLKGFYLYLYSGKAYYPCFQCSKIIAQVGISKIFIDAPTNIQNLTDFYRRYDIDTSKEILKECGVEINYICGEM